MSMELKLEEAAYFDFCTHHPTTAAVSDADSGPTAEVFEDATDTTVVALTVTKRTSKTGNYRVPVTAAAADGFEVGKTYNVVASATVNSIVGKGVIGRFKVRARGQDDLAYPATSGRSMVVDAAGLVDANMVKAGPTGSGTAQTARDIGASVLLSPGTGTGQLDITSGVTKANTTQFAGSAITSAAGIPEVKVASIAAGAIAAATFAANALDAVWSTATRVLTAATNLTTALATPTNITAGTITTVTNLTNDPPGVTTLLARLGAFTGTGVNTVLGFLKALLSKTASTPSDVGGTFDASTDSTEAVRDRGDAAWTTATGFSTLDAAGVRSAVGLGSANLDTQLGDLPTNAELATSQAAADDATLAAIAALNNLSAAQVNAEVDTAIADAALATAANLATVAGYLDTEIAATLAAVLDLVKASHTRTNTAQAGAAGTITLDAGASAVDDYYNNQILVIASGTGAGQARFISDYVGSTKVASVATWATNPDNTSVFAIIPFGAIPGATAPTAVEVRQEIDNNSTQLAAIKAKTDALPSDPADASVVAGLIAAVEAKVDTVDTVVDAVKLKTDNLPSDPADQSLMIAATDAIVTAVGTRASQTSVDDLPTNAELATALAAADDAVLAAIAALNNLSSAQAASAVGAIVVEGAVTLIQSLRLSNAAAAGKLSGAATTSIALRNLADSLDRISATVDADGNRSAVTVNLA